MARVSVKFDGVEQLGQRIADFGEGAGQIIQGVYEDFAAKEIKENIIPLIHPSGRTFKGHRQGARSAGPEKVFKHSVKELSLVVSTNRPFGYLYFPDDGSTTSSHQGNQHFMDRGLQRSVDGIIERCVAALTKDF